MQRDMEENAEDVNGLNEIKALAESIKNISDKILDLFKQVGRRFYNQYPEIITDYVMFYKEMYGEEEG